MPAAINEAVAPDNVHTLVVEDAYATERPELAEALNVSGTLTV